MSDPNEQSGISVTIKGDEPGGKYNDPKSPGTWLVFHGSPARVKEQIIEVFELDADAASRPLFDLVNEATRLFKASATVSQQLGGRVVTSEKSESKAEDAPAKTEDKGTPEKDDPNAWLREEIEKAQSRDELKTLWAQNKAAFDSDESLMSDWKAKGKSLPS